MFLGGSALIVTAANMSPRGMGIITATEHTLQRDQSRSRFVYGSASSKVRLELFCASRTPFKLGNAAFTANAVYTQRSSGLLGSAIREILNGW